MIFKPQSQDYKRVSGRLQISTKNADELLEERDSLTRGWKKQFYRRYLLSKEWRDKRKQVLERDQGVCQRCGDAANHAHHLTYDRIFREPLYDLISLCKPCHDFMEADIADPRW